MMAMKSEDIENQRKLVKIAIPQQENKTYNSPRDGEDAAFSSAVRPRSKLFVVMASHHT